MHACVTDLAYSLYLTDMYVKKCTYCVVGVSGGCSMYRHDLQLQKKTDSDHCDTVICDKGF